jgi:N-acetylglucosaminyl-diphospho-decaprenol L-rhamnosyltransferase
MIVAVPLDLAVQIVNYRTREHLGPCLRALLDDLAESPLAHRTFVLDNASGDDLGALAAAHARDPVEFHAAERNLGFGAGHNRLASLHDARALLLLNPDTLLPGHGTAAALHAVLAEAGVAAAGPQLVSETGAIHGWDHGELHGARARLAGAAGHSHARERRERAEVAWVSGACAAIARPWFDAVGGFDPGFFLYKEEEDLFLRMRRLGARIVYEPALRVLHHQSVTGARSEHLEASVRRYRDKHVPAGVRRRVLPPLHREVVAWEGRLRRARALVRGRDA